MRTHCLSLLLLLLLFLSPQPATALNFSQYKTLISLSHSLLSRVAAARGSRGDLAGAARARSIAGKLRLLGGGRDLYAVAWDFAWNYGFRGGLPTAESYEIGAELLEVVGEVSGLDSGADRARWVIRNHERVIGIAEALLRSLLRVFSKSGPLREAILVLQSEVVEGELLKDLMEVGAKDLVGASQLSHSFKILSTNSTSQPDLGLQERVIRYSADGFMVVGFWLSNYFTRSIGGPLDLKKISTRSMCFDDEI